MKASLEPASVTGKLVLTGRLVFGTPLIIGSGEQDDDVDLVVLRDESGQPFIPATSFAGALRHFFFRTVDVTGADNEKFSYFWGAQPGGSKDEIYQSALMVSDLHPIGQVSVAIRDGVKIDLSTHTAAEGAKFDYEVVEPTSAFALRAEITLREAYDTGDLFKMIAAFLIESLAQGKIALGAMTTKGFGRCRLDDYALYHYDFRLKEAVIDWLGGTNKEAYRMPELPEHDRLVKKKDRDFVLQADFSLRSSLIVRSYSVRPSQADAIHLSSAGKPILPGSSLKGALRSRAETIVNTLGGQGKEKLRPLFGWVSEDKASQEACKSRVIVEETPVQNAVWAKQQRIKVDRFTGGTIRNALFDSEPLWTPEPGLEQVRVKVTVRDCAPWEAGLMLLLLKDLWTSDLPIGGEKSIGRGTLMGRQAEIIYGSEKYILTQEPTGTLQIHGDQARLEQLVSQFVQEISGREHTEDGGSL